MSIESKIEKNIELNTFTTFRIGGVAEYFVEVGDIEELDEAFEWAKEKNKEVSILGGGSNLLINSKGVIGLVIKINNKEIKVMGDRLNCGAGADLNQVFRIASNNGFSGFEWAVGIPRITVGGAVIGNAGAYNMKTSDIVENVEVYDMKKRKTKIFSNKDCMFSYKRSVFSVDQRYIVWSVVFRCKKDKPFLIQKRARDLLTKRQTSQSKLPNAGCIFKNISFDEIENNSLALSKLAQEERVIRENQVAAGWIIDKAGLKGKSIGGAKISLEHANFIINTGKASSDDVLALINFIKETIKKIYKISLQEEIKYLGY